MTFDAPARLLGLILPLGLAVWYLIQRRVGRRFIVRFSSLELAEAVAPRRPGWRRHLTAAAALTGIVILTLGFARPVVAVPVPVEQATLVLAIDVSLSMAAEDVAPTRMVAAQQAALTFLELAPEELRIGVVAFAGTALPVVAVGADRALVAEAVGRLGLGQGTAVGEAIFSSVDQIRLSSPPEGVPAAIVVLSDGETTMGRPESEAVVAARQAGIPVHTIAFGTPRGMVTFEGETIPVPVNPGAMVAVAEATGGIFFRVATESELGRVLELLGTQIGYETKEREVTDWFAAAGLLAAALGVAGSLRWFGRVV